MYVCICVGVHVEVLTFLLHVLIVCVCMCQGACGGHYISITCINCVCVCRGACGSQRITCGNQLSPVTIWIPETELRHLYIPSHLTRSLLYLWNVLPDTPEGQMSWVPEEALPMLPQEAAPALYPHLAMERYGMLNTFNCEALKCRRE